MADRRCLHKKITESDDFYSLSAAAQALYMHLNQNADDDGFINNAKSISQKIRNGNNALAELVKQRFLLQFGGVYVVKHWRVSNSLKNDRLKPLNYPGLASKIWVKENRGYTDHFSEGYKTLFEVKSGIHLESIWNPNRTEPNRTEPNRTEPNRTADGCEADSWDERFELFFSKYPKNTGRSEAMAEWRKLAPESTQEDKLFDKIMASLDFWIWSEKWQEAGGQYIPKAYKWLEERKFEFRPPTINGAPIIYDEYMRRSIRDILEK